MSPGRLEGVRHERRADLRRSGPVSTPSGRSRTSRSPAPPDSRFELASITERSRPRAHRGRGPRPSRAPAVLAGLTPAQAGRLLEECNRVLTENTVTSPDGSRFTVAARGLYPHIWGWDSGLISMAHDPLRGLDELESQLKGQWADGRLPHIVYQTGVSPTAYFPYASRWDVKRASPLAPQHGPDTSGIIQPPVQGLALLELLRASESARPQVRKQIEARVRELFPKVLAWNRYLLTKRDPEGSGIPTILHPWESGHDNSPQWDAALAHVPVREDVPGSYERTDLKHADPAMRPTQQQYDRYVTLLERYKAAHYDDATLYQSLNGPDPYPFMVKDVHMGAILLRANKALLEAGRRLGVSRPELEEIQGWIDRGRRGLEARWDEELGGPVPYDVVTRQPIRKRTIALFAPLIAGEVAPDRLQQQLSLLHSQHFLGNPKLTVPLVTSTGAREPEFDSRRYWRGPTWPIMDLLLTQGLRELGLRGEADAIRDACIRQLYEKGLYEYFDPITGEGIGSPDQSWTAAAAKIWIEEARAEAGRRSRSTSDG